VSATYPHPFTKRSNIVMASGGGRQDGDPPIFAVVSSYAVQLYGL
jgi:hypothetical protein